MDSRREAGFTLLELLVTLGVIAILLGLLLGAVQKVRASAARTQCANQLRQLGTGLHNHHGTYGRFPPGVRRRPDPFPYLSWLTRILPELEQPDAWREAQDDYRRDLAFVGPPPHRNLARVMPLFLCPSGDRSVGTTEDGVTAAFTYYLGVTGRLTVAHDGVLYLNSAVRFADITDGASTTLLVGERPPSPDHHFGWWYAGVGQTGDGSADFVLAVRETNRTFRAPTCPRGPYPFARGRLDDPCSTFHFWSLHSGGANFLFADGAVAFLSYSSDAILPALATRAGAETISLP